MSKADASVTKALHAWQTQQAAGISLAESLGLCAQLCQQAGARDCFLEAAERARRGESIERLLGALAPFLSEAERATIAAGWNGGRVEAVLGSVVAQRELWEAARSRIFAKMMMPACVLIMASFIAPLPSFVMGGSPIGYLLSALTPLVVAFLLWRLYAYLMSRDRHGGGSKLAFDRFKLTVPVLQQVERNRNLAEFSTYLSNLLAAGLTISEALEICGRAASNEVYARSIAGVAGVIRSGNPLASALSPAELWPQEFIATIKIGEQSGTLDEVLTRQSGSYRDSYVRAVETFADWLPRLAYGLIAAFMIFFILKTALGYFSMLNSLVP